MVSKELRGWQALARGRRPALGGCRGRNSRHLVTYELENFLFPYFRRSPEAASVQITGQCEAGCWAAEVGARRGTVPPRPRVARPAFLLPPRGPRPALVPWFLAALPFSQCHGDSRSRKQASGNIKLPESCPPGAAPCCWRLPPSHPPCAAGPGVLRQVVRCLRQSVMKSARCCYSCVVATVALLSSSPAQFPEEA